MWQRKWDECDYGRVTYEFIKNVRFAEMNVLFEPSLWMGFILAGHGSMNAFLYERGLSRRNVRVVLSVKTGSMC